MQFSADVAAGLDSGDVTVKEVPSFNTSTAQRAPPAGSTYAGSAGNPPGANYDNLIQVTAGGAGQSQPSPIPNG